MVAAPIGAILETDHLSRHVGSSRVVDDITLEVRRGEVLAIVGASGAGKSSFLRLLGGAAWWLDARIEPNLCLSPYQSKSTADAPSWRV